MRYEKLDKRFKMQQRGLAKSMVLVSIAGFRVAGKIMADAYGHGTYIPSYQRGHQIPNKGAWFYEAVYIPRVDVGLNDKITRTKVLGHYRIYFRNEEQEMFLKLAMPDEN